MNISDRLRELREVRSLSQEIIEQLARSLRRGYAKQHAIILRVLKSSAGGLLNDSAEQGKGALVQTVILVDEQIDFKPRDGTVWLAEPESNDLIIFAQSDFFVSVCGQHIGGLAGDKYPPARTCAAYGSHPLRMPRKFAHAHGKTNTRGQTLPLLKD